MKATWKTELPALAVPAAMFALSALQWNQVPDRVPVHWGVSGQPDGWGPRAEALLIMPLAALVIYAVMAIAPMLDPSRDNYRHFAGSYRVIRLAVLGFFAAIHVAMIEAFHGVHVDMTQVIFPLVGLLFLVLGAVMGRVRRNWTTGIRTPWTLTSRLSWERTHRAGGRVFAAMGMVWIALGFTHRAWAIGVAVCTMMAAVLGLVAYSYVVWKSDPDKHPLGDIGPENEG